MTVFIYIPELIGKGFSFQAMYISNYLKCDLRLISCRESQNVKCSVTSTKSSISPHVSDETCQIGIISLCNSKANKGGKKEIAAQNIYTAQTHR